MDVRSAPQGIGQTDLSDQFPNFWRNPWQTSAASRLPAPERFETAPMPSHDSLRLDNDDRIQRTRPQSIEPDEEEPIRIPELQPFRRSTQRNIDLWAKGQVVARSRSHDWSHEAAIHHSALKNPTIG